MVSPYCNIMGGLAAVFFASMIPVSELRAAIPVGIAAGGDPLTVALVCIVGNMIPVPFVILFIRKILAWLRTVSPWFESLVERFDARIAGKAETVMKYERLGLLLFVAIPFPGTGAYTGAAIAAMLDMRLKYAVPLIFGGVCIAACIVTLLTVGIVSL